MERDCFQPIKWQEIWKQSLCSENSKIVSLLSERIFLSKETVFEFPVIWLVENSLFQWDFFKMKKSQNIRNRALIVGCISELVEQSFTWKIYKVCQKYDFCENKNHINSHQDDSYC